MNNDEVADLPEAIDSAWLDTAMRMTTASQEAAKVATLFHALNQPEIHGWTVAVVMRDEAFPVELSSEVLARIKPEVLLYVKATLAKKLAEIDSAVVKLTEVMI